VGALLGGELAVVPGLAHDATIVAASRENARIRFIGAETLPESFAPPFEVGATARDGRTSRARTHDCRDAWSDHRGPAAGPAGADRVRPHRSRALRHRPAGPRAGHAAARPRRAAAGARLRGRLPPALGRPAALVRLDRLPRGAGLP